MKIVRDPVLRSYVDAKLDAHWSPNKISRKMRGTKSRSTCPKIQSIAGFGGAGDASGGTVGHFTLTRISMSDVLGSVGTDSGR